MRKHHFVLVGVALLLAACGLVAVLLWPRDDRPVSRARCERVKVGMTLAEVEAVLGGPPGNYGTGEVELNLGMLDDGVHSSPQTLLWKRCRQHELWKGDDGLFFVCFDEQGQVAAQELIPGRRVTYLDKLRAWLGF